MNKYRSFESLIQTLFGATRQIVTYNIYLPMYSIRRISKVFKL